MVSAAGSVLVIGALIVGSLELHKSLHASEVFASSHADQRRLIDYTARDLRRAIAIARSEAGAVRRAAGETLSLTEGVSLVLTLPGYYRSDAPASADFDQPLPVITFPAGVDYGSSAGPAPGIVVSFRKIFVAAEGCVCFVRQEADASQVIVRRAEDLDLQITVAADGKSCALVASFQSTYSRARPQVSTYDEIMLRNLRNDSPE
jgi:hypothetical protein